MPSEKKSFDFWYAVHNTQIVHVPSRALETFGETRIHYYHLAELPDVPTLGELGYYPDWLGSSRLIAAPAGVSDEVITFYEAAFI